MIPPFYLYNNYIIKILKNQFKMKMLKKCVKILDTVRCLLKEFKYCVKNLDSIIMETSN